MPPAKPSSFPALSGRPVPGALQGRLAEAARGLWLATLSLMTAYMQTQAPAHRYLLARRIARNLTTLSQQPDAFNADSCRRFARLAARWDYNAERHAPGAGQATPAGRFLASIRRLATPR